MPIKKHWLTLKNSLRYHPACRRLRAHAAELHAAMIRPTDAAKTVRKMEQLCSAVRLLDGSPRIRALESRLLGLRDAARMTRQAWAPALSSASKSPVLIKKAVILKPKVSDNEPGVIFISFEHQWAKLLHLPRMEALARDYTLVVSPTWSPPHTALNVVFPELWPQPVHCLISNEEDLAALPRLSSNYRMVPLLASNWVDEEMFQPLPKAERDIDLAMLANFAPYKRHYLFFDALRQLPRGLKIVLVGRPNGRRTDEVLLNEAEAYGVRDRFELRYRVTDEEVVQTLCRAKASIILSQREGSCVAVIESMFADTPVGLVEGAHIGSAKFLSAETGMFLKEQALAAQLMTLIEKSAHMHPRAAALRQGLGARMSSVTLNAHLKHSAHDTGKAWTRDLAAMHWRPNPHRLHPEENLWADEEHARISSEYGVMIGRPTGWDMSQEN